MLSENQPISIEARIATQTELALLEYGKQILLKSSDTAIDFHKTMLQISATFGTLITTITPILVWGDKDAKIPMPEGWLLILPVFLMLLSSIAFAIGYYPRYIQFNPNIVEEIKKVRERINKVRSLLAGVGLGLFCAALISLICIILWLRPV